MFLVFMAFLKEGKTPSRWALWIVVERKLELSGPLVIGPLNVNADQSRMRTHLTEHFVSTFSSHLMSLRHNYCFCCFGGSISSEEFGFVGAFEYVLDFK